MTFFFVIDGLGQEAGHFLNTVMDQFMPQDGKPPAEQLKLRLFLSATPEVAHTINNIPGLIKIELDPEGDSALNVEDVYKFIFKRLAKSDIFNHDGSVAMIKQEDDVLKKIVENVQNDYSRLNLVVRELEQCFHQRQLDGVLARLKEDISLKFAREIKSLNQKFSQDEIVELNAILTCMEGLSPLPRGGLPFRVVEQFVDHTLNFRRFSQLKQHIEHIYHSFFDLDFDESMTWRSEKLRHYLIDHAEDERKIEQIYQKRGQAFTEWDLEEVDLLEKIVETNLQNVFGSIGEKLFSRYGFADFFASKRPRAQRRAYICLDRGQSHVHALQLCLHALYQGKENEGLKYLREHARSRLVQLFADADPNHATLEQKEAIKKMSLQLVNDDSCIAIWSEDEEWSESMRDIYDNDAPIRKWINLLIASDDSESSEQQSYGLLFEHTYDTLIRLWMERGKTAWKNARKFMQKELSDGWYEEDDDGYIPLEAVSPFKTFAVDIG